jgi:hypothetical protein
MITLKLPKTEKELKELLVKSRSKLWNIPSWKGTQICNLTRKIAIIESIIENKFNSVEGG